MTKGFTLLELLIVIGILAILATAAVLVLNPAELLRQARDSTRVSDLASLNSALGLYVTSFSSPDLDNPSGWSFTCGTNWATYDHLARPTSSLSGVYSSTTGRGTDGTGWIPVNLSAMSGGSPIASLPVDPSGSAGFNYSYGCNNTDLLYELNANLESAKFTTGTDNKENSDGGNGTTTYEIGTSLTL